MTFTNTSASTVTVTLYLIPSAGTAGAANTIVTTVPIAANGTYEAYPAENHVLASGDFIQALCSAATSCTLMVSGIQILNS